MADLGTDSTESVDYPPICAAVGRTVRDGGADFGIVLGGSGQGEQLAANKVRGVRAGCETPRCDGPQDRCRHAATARRFIGSHGEDAHVGALEDS